MTENRWKYIVGLLIAVIIAALGITNIPSIDDVNVVLTPGTATLSPEPSSTPSPSPTAQRSVVQIDNGAFENWWDAQGRPWGWTPVVNECDSNYNPRFEADMHSDNVHSGLIAGRVYQDWRTCTMTLYQIVKNIPVDHVIELEAYGLPRSRDINDREIDSYINVTVCLIDGDEYSYTAVMACSTDTGRMGSYSKFNLSIVSKSGAVVIVLNAKPNWGVARSDVWWDDVNLFDLSN